MSLLSFRCVSCGSKFSPNVSCNKCRIRITDKCFKCHNQTYEHIQNKNAIKYSIEKTALFYGSTVVVIIALIAKVFV